MSALVRMAPAQLLGATRVGVFSIILLILVIDQVLQKNFVNTGVLFPIYTIVGVAFASHLLWLMFKKKSEVLFSSALLMLDVVLISGLIYYSGTSQILFSFLYLIHILLAGLLTGARGAQMVSLMSALCFTLVMILGDEVRGPSFLFLLAINNAAFFIVAGLASYLSEQLSFMSEEVKSQVQQLRALRNLNELILREMPVGIVSFTNESEMISVNPVLRKLLPDFSFREFNLEARTRNLRTGESTETFEVHKKNTLGEDRNILVKVSKMLEPQTRSSLFIASFQDFTQFRKLEASVRQSEKLAAIGTLAAGIAHEIRNPLAGISGSIQLMSQTTHNDDDKKLMSIVLKEIDRLNQLITDFLDYAKPEQEPSELVDLRPLMEEVLQFVAVAMSDKLPMNVKQDVQLVAGARVRAHRDRLKQVFLNLFMNAYQAMEKSESPVLHVQSRVEEGQLAIEISDSGQGMSEKTKQKLFEPFYTTKSKGTGLGLAMTHKILEGHRAQIFVESEENRGAKFKILLPLAE